MTDMPVPATPPSGLAGEIARLLRLAAPIALSRFGALLLVLVDIAMLGHYDATELAYYGLGNAVAMVLFLVGVGMLIGIAVLTSQALGAGRDRDCGTIWRVGLLHALALGFAAVMVCLAGGPLLRLLGQESGLAAGGGRAALLLGLGMPGALLFLASSLFLEAIGRPRVGVLVMFAGNIVNIALNLPLIHGWPLAGFDGAAGAAAATSVVRWLMALALAFYVLGLPEAARLNLRGPLENPWLVSARLRRLGYGFGLAQGLESGAFASLTIFAGRLGAIEVASYQVAQNAIAFVFMLAVGIATATGVGVGHAVGRRDGAGMARAGWSGVVAILVCMTATAIIVETLPGPIAWLFSDDEAVLALAAPALAVAGLTMLPDGAQAVLMEALRGAGDVWMPTALHLVAFIGVMVPAAWLFALPLGGGVTGLLWGVLAGVAVAALLLALRFLRLSRRLVTPA